MRILTVSEMRSLETAANAAGHSYRSMMEEAGKAVAQAIFRRRSVTDREVLVLVGPGNNGGDGLVAAKYLSAQGANVTAYLAREPTPSDADIVRQAIAGRVTMVTANDDPDHSTLIALTRQADVLIDALLGTGAKPPLRGIIADIISDVGIASSTRNRKANVRLTELQQPPRSATACPLTVAVDGPSGIDFDSGAADPACLHADITVTFAAPKWGHLRFPAASFVGELIIADIGIPAEITWPEGPEVVTADMAQRLLPERPLDGHKGTFGTVLIVAGSANYTGAAILAATSAVRSGAGLVTLAIPDLLHTAIVPAIPEATYLLLPHTVGVLDERAVTLIREKLPQTTVLLLGPGLGNHLQTKRFLKQFLGLESESSRLGFLGRRDLAADVHSTDLPPMVVDADGLNILSEIPGWPTLLPPDSVLTPHPGEMARLCQTSVSQIQADRVRIAHESAQQWGHTVVLKGAFTVVATGNQEPVVIPFANPGLSSGGTGDVLAGAIAALRAQGLSAFPAAIAGAYLHGLAGEILRGRFGVSGIRASDIANTIPDAQHRLRQCRIEPENK